MRLRVIGSATLSLSYPLLVATSIHAQTPQPAPPERRSPLSEIAHDFTTWLSHITAPGTDHHRAASSPPLPRPRPPELVPAPVASNKEPSEIAPAPVAPKKKMAAPVLIND